MKYVLVIAGSDSSGGAGVQADIRTIAHLGAHPLTALTAVTAQNSLGITGIHKIPVPFVIRQLGAIMDDIVPDAVKIGMLYSKEAVVEVARLIKRHSLPNVVVDPVLRSTTGGDLLEPEAISALKEVLLPAASVVTPNLFEAEILTNKKVLNLRQMTAAAKLIKRNGPDVVVTGGHLTDRCVDILYNGIDFHQFSGSRIEADHTHGTGCVFSTALATFMALDEPLVNAVRLAHDLTRSAIVKGYPCGQGSGPVHPGSWKPPYLN